MGRDCPRCHGVQSVSWGHQWLQPLPSLGAQRPCPTEATPPAPQVLQKHFGRYRPWIGGVGGDRTPNLWWRQVSCWSAFSSVLSLLAHGDSMQLTLVGGSTLCCGASDSWSSTPIRHPAAW